MLFATGPSFKKNVTLEPIESVNLVPLIAHLLGVEAEPNNGTVKVFKNVLTGDLNSGNRPVGDEKGGAGEHSLVNDDASKPGTAGHFLVDKLNEKETTGNQKQSALVLPGDIDHSKNDMLNPIPEDDDNGNSPDGLSDFTRFIYY